MACFFEVLGSNNDMNVLNPSPLFNDVFKGEAPNVNFTVNVHEYKHGTTSLMAYNLGGMCL
jgi:hypothetical protein